MLKPLDRPFLLIMTLLKVLMNLFEFNCVARLVGIRTLNNVFKKFSSQQRNASRNMYFHGKYYNSMWRLTAPATGRSFAEHVKQAYKPIMPPYQMTDILVMTELIGLPTRVRLKFTISKLSPPMAIVVFRNSRLRHVEFISPFHLINIA